MRYRRLIPNLLASLLILASRPSAAVEIPFQQAGGMIGLKVTVAGSSAPLNFLLDSGAGASVIDLNAARRLGLNLNAPQTVAGVHGRAVAYRVKGFVGKVGEVPVSTSILAIDLSALGTAGHQRIDGLLGADFFRSHIVQIDFGAQTIRLLQRDELNTAGCEVLPLAARNDTYCARISIDGNPAQWLRLDTGCNSALEWVATADWAEKMGSVREVHTDVQWGSKRIGGVKTGIHTTQMFPGEAGLIGTGLLSRFTVTIDTARHCCLLASR